jgi:D-glycero-alpha-D-manno-heptose-7-phosphate kinase
MPSHAAAAAASAAPTTIHATAPIRVCDLGGWTDTWFAGHGTVVHLAVEPLVHVRIDVSAHTDHERPRVLLDVVDYGDRYTLTPDDDRRTPRHPLLEAAIDEVGVDPDTHLDIAVHSEAPAGCSTGTSAAVAVALVGALTAARRRRPSPLDVARTAHRLETERLGLQSGIQDQLASAFGGINRIDMQDYPDATVTPVALDRRTVDELDRRLVVVFLGRRHDSSAVHDKVIAELTGEGPDSPRLDALRGCAERGHEALTNADLDAFARAMVDNTDAQSALHPDLDGPEATRAIAVARSQGCTGWKVNGAGGEGGSVSLLLAADQERERLTDALTAADPSFEVLPSRLASAGLTVRTEAASTRPST